MEYVVGIDGGGTKTSAIILDTTGRIIGYGEGGPSTYGVVSTEVTRESIASAVRQACQAANLSTPIFASAFLGLGNVVSDMDRKAVQIIAADLGLAPVERIGVDHDCRIALSGGLSGRPGIVLIAGTGTSCFGLNLQKQSWRSGGWGPLIDDEGSGYWLGIQAMRAAVREYDGRNGTTILTSMVQNHLQLEEMNELMNRLYAGGMTRSDIAKMAPLVFKAAKTGDKTAFSILQTGCQSMADCVLAVARKLRMDQEKCELAIVGGLTQAGDMLIRLLSITVYERLPKCKVIQAELSPAIGAAILALQMLKGPLEPGIAARIKEEADKPYPQNNINDEVSI